MTNTAATATQSVTTYGPNLPRPLCDRGDIIVHRTGCADTTKGAYRRLHKSQIDAIDASSVEDIVDFVYGGFGEYDGTDSMDEYEGYRGGIYVFPCVDLPEHKAV